MYESGFAPRCESITALFGAGGYCCLQDILPPAEARPFQILLVLLAKYDAIGCHFNQRSMSAFLNSGRSDVVEIANMTDRFRPLADDNKLAP